MCHSSIPLECKNFAIFSVMGAEKDSYFVHALHFQTKFDVEAASLLGILKPHSFILCYLKRVLHHASCLVKMHILWTANNAMISLATSCSHRWQGVFTSRAQVCHSLKYPLFIPILTLLAGRGTSSRLSYSKRLLLADS